MSDCQSAITTYSDLLCEMDLDDEEHLRMHHGMEFSDIEVFTVKSFKELLARYNGLYRCHDLELDEGVVIAFIEIRIACDPSDEAAMVLDGNHRLNYLVNNNIDSVAIRVFERRAPVVKTMRDKRYQVNLAA